MTAHVHKSIVTSERASSTERRRARQPGPDAPTGTGRSRPAALDQHEQ
jgi:hypothetical protein